MIERNVIIEITDNGSGISEKNLKKLFVSKFTTKKQGTGIGLTLCKEIVTRYGWSLEAESTEHEGSTFRIVMPLN